MDTRAQGGPSGHIPNKSCKLENASQEQSDLCCCVTSAVAKYKLYVLIQREDLIEFALISHFTFPGYVRDTLLSYEPLMVAFGVINLVLAATWLVRVICECRRRRAYERI